MAQAMLRIGQQAYITRRFYGHEESLGRQAQRAGDQARELAKKDRAAAAACSARPSASAGPRPTTRRPRRRPEGAGEGQRASARGAGDDEADDAAEGPADADRQGRRGAPEVRVPIGRPGGSRSKSGGKRRR